jgi:hypothetical protein
MGFDSRPYCTHGCYRSRASSPLSLSDTWPSALPCCTAQLVALRPHPPPFHRKFPVKAASSAARRGELGGEWRRRESAESSDTLKIFSSFYYFTRLLSLHFPLLRYPLPQLYLVCTRLRDPQALSLCISQLFATHSIHSGFPHCLPDALTLQAEIS